MLTAWTPILDLLLAAVSAPAACLLAGARRFGLDLLPLTKRVLLFVGVFPIRDHYYEPLFHPKHIRKDLSVPRVLPGIDMRESEQLTFLRAFSPSLNAHLDSCEPGGAASLSSLMENSTFGPGDAEFLYQFIRCTRPSRIVEIGSGNSTRIADLALRHCVASGSTKAEHTCIEPYEMPWLEQLGPKILRTKVEDCNFSIFNELDNGDVLFIDSSHMIRPQGDVLYEYLEILPRLKRGVYIHLHDIFTPRDYPRKWVVDEVRFWNEQYLLEAMLSGSTRYEVVAAVNWLKHTHFVQLQSVCPYLLETHEPGSFYIRVV